MVRLPARVAVAEASEVAINDVAIIPLRYRINAWQINAWQINVWAMRRGLTYPARADEYTLAHNVRPAS